MSSTPYDRQTSFALLSAENPGEPHSGATLDAEFNAIKLAIDDTQQNLDLITDDDGALARGSVGRAQLDASISLGFGAPSQWASGVLYTADTDTVFQDSKFYICTVTHTSGVSFESDNWEEIADFTLAAVIEDGSITSAKLATGAVTADKIGAGSISSDKLATGAVTNTKIADSAVTTAKIADANVTLAKLANEVLPAGLGPLPWSGLTAPTGWVLTGATYNRADYPALWAFAAAEITGGNTFYGVGDGSTTFTIASMAGRVPAGREAAASVLTSSFFGGDSTVLGATGGSEKHTLVQTEHASYALSFTQPTFQTNANDVLATTAITYGGASGPINVPTNTANGSVTPVVPVAANSGGSDAPHNNTQPTRIVNFIVKAH